MKLCLNTVATPNVPVYQHSCFSGHMLLTWHTAKSSVCLVRSLCWSGRSDIYFYFLLLFTPGLLVDAGGSSSILIVRWSKQTFGLHRRLSSSQDGTDEAHFSHCSYLLRLRPSSVAVIKALIVLLLLLFFLYVIMKHISACRSAQATGWTGRSGRPFFNPRISLLAVHLLHHNAKKFTKNSAANVGCQEWHCLNSSVVEGSPRPITGPLILA